MLGQRAEADASTFQLRDDVKQVRLRAAKAVELPDDEQVAGAVVGKAGLQAGLVVLRARSVIVMEVAIVDDLSNYLTSCRYYVLNGKLHLSIASVVEIKTKRFVEIG